MQAIYKISSRSFYIRRHMRHRCVYILWTYLICTVVRRLIYFFDLYAQVLGFSMFQWTFFSEVYEFGKFEMRWSSNPHLKQVWFPTVMFNTLIIRVVWIEGLSFIHLIISLMFKHLPIGCEPSKWLYLNWEKFTHSIFPTKWSKFKQSICEVDIDNDFWSIFIFLSSILTDIHLLKRSKITRFLGGITPQPLWLNPIPVTLFIMVIYGLMIPIVLDGFTWMTSSVLRQKPIIIPLQLFQIPKEI